MPVPCAKLEVDFANNAGSSGIIRPLNGTNWGPLMGNGFFDYSTEFKELGFPIVRLHDCPYTIPETVDVHAIFPIFDADPQDPNNYRFTMTDDYIQSILDAGSQIIYRLGESIEHYTRRKYHVHPPKDFEKWADICINIIRHYNQGWADGFHHNIRYWEIWNEPDNIPLNWTGKIEDFYRLYEITSKKIKAFDPTLKVGGPTADKGVPDWGFLNYCRQTNSPLDFYSWHIYARDPVEVTELAAQHREAVTQAGYPEAEMHLNEWNYLPAEGWLFFVHKTAEYMHRANAEISGLPGAVFDAAILIYMQDSPIDVATFYLMSNATFGILDGCGGKLKNYYAFKAFRSLLDTPLRVQSTPANDAGTGYALLAGLNTQKNQAGILLSNFRAREAFFTLTLNHWPWPGKAICKRYLLDYARDLTLVEEYLLDPADPTINLCMPAPAFSYMTLTPAEDQPENQ